MRGKHGLWVATSLALSLLAAPGAASGVDAPLPTGVKAVWDVSKAYRDTTPTAERICINGLWRWQPVAELSDAVPAGDWGYYKVPAPWSANSQTLYPQPGLERQEPERPTWPGTSGEITIPAAWQGRRIAVYAEYLNSYAAVYLDGKKLGDMYFPSGEVDITAACRPGEKHVLSLCVKAVPLAAVMLAFTDTSTPKTVKGNGGTPRPVRRRLPGEHAETSPRRRRAGADFGAQVDHYV